MDIIGTNVDAFMALQSLESNKDVRLNVFEHMAEMNGAVGIG
jgi:hypothetical protein